MNLQQKSGQKEKSHAACLKMLLSNSNSSIVLSPK